MASDGSAGAITAASAVLSSQASDPTKFQPASGKTLPQSGNGAAATAAPSVDTAADVFSQSSKTGTAHASSVSAQVTSSAPGKNAKAPPNPSTAKTTATSTSDPRVLTAQLNKALNNSGRADQFRVDPTSGKYIQQVNPTSGEVIAEYSVSEFPALARSIGASGLLVDETA